MGRESREEKHRRKVSGGDWLRLQRERRGWTQSELADRLDGVSNHSISGYERGTFDIDYGIVRDIARVLKLSELETWLGLCLPLPKEVLKASGLRQQARDQALVERRVAEDPGNFFRQLNAQLAAQRRDGAVKATRREQVPHMGDSGTDSSQRDEPAV